MLMEYIKYLQRAININLTKIIVFLTLTFISTENMDVIQTQILIKVRGIC